MANFRDFDRLRGTGMEHLLYYAIREEMRSISDRMYKPAINCEHTTQDKTPSIVLTINQIVKHCDQIMPGLRDVTKRVKDEKEKISWKHDQHTAMMTYLAKCPYATVSVTLLDKFVVTTSVAISDLLKEPIMQDMLKQYANAHEKMFYERYFIFREFHLGVKHIRDKTIMRGLYKAGLPKEIYHIIRLYSKEYYEGFCFSYLDNILQQAY